MILTSCDPRGGLCVAPSSPHLMTGRLVRRTVYGFDYCQNGYWSYKTGTVCFADLTAEPPYPHALAPAWRARTI